ncbi:unnamed protein product, partial [Bubo scandiacus]
ATVCHKTCSKSRAGVWICQLGGRGWEPLLLEKTFERKKKNHVVIKQDKKPCQRNVDLASFQRVNVVIREGRKDSEGKDIVLHWAPARKALPSLPSLRRCKASVVKQPHAGVSLCLCSGILSRCFPSLHNWLSMGLSGSSSPFGKQSLFLPSSFSLALRRRSVAGTRCRRMSMPAVAFLMEIRHR